MSFLFILSFAMVFGVTDDGLKPVPVQEGKNAHFMVNTTMPITHLRIGGNESFSASPLYMRVGQDNNIKVKNNTIYSGRLIFDGNLQRGQAWVTLENVGPSDYGKVFRLYYVEDGKAPTKKDFVIRPEAGNNTKENITKIIVETPTPKPARNGKTTTYAPESYPNNDTSQVNSTVKTKNGTSPNNSTHEPSNSSSGVVLPIVLVIAIPMVIYIIKFGICYIKRRKSRAIAQGNADVENQQPLPPGDANANHTLSEDLEMNAYIRNPDDYHVEREKRKKVRVEVERMAEVQHSLIELEEDSRSPMAL
ncbi:uncharacterized protein LOC116287596 [Actinia tenebrosa]|uniref:Uncharacterized protein LOC116287596 n=1 Tax=Actinia tenebrosa TaxID=6105 RepID=A0A6P8HCA3_ACTTE|nr:uncharacterized protein LOC116287596 [Actinia tenebrosa]